MSQPTLMSKRTGKPFRVLQATPSWMEEEQTKEVTGTSLLWTLLVCALTLTIIFLFMWEVFSLKG